jgi:hypothetical protein
MWKHSLRIGTLALCLAGFAPMSSAQTAGNLNGWEAGQIRVPAPWKSSLTPASPVDLPGFHMGLTPETHNKIRVGPVELDRRTSAPDAPWRPQVPYFQRSHEALSLSFDIHRRPQ